MAYSYEGLGQPKRALDTWRQIVSRYPETSSATIARHILERQGK